LSLNHVRKVLDNTAKLVLRNNHQPPLSVICNNSQYPYTKKDHIAFASDVIEEHVAQKYMKDLWENDMLLDDVYGNRSSLFASHVRTLLLTERTYRVRKCPMETTQNRNNSEAVEKNDEQESKKPKLSQDGISLGGCTAGIQKVADMFASVKCGPDNVAYYQDRASMLPPPPLPLLPPLPPVDDFVPPDSNDDANGDKITNDEDTAVALPAGGNGSKSNGATSNADGGANPLSFTGAKVDVGGENITSIARTNAVSSSSPPMATNADIAASTSPSAAKDDISYDGTTGSTSFTDVDVYTGAGALQPWVDCVYKKDHVYYVIKSTLVDKLTIDVIKVKEMLENLGVTDHGSVVFLYAIHQKQFASFETLWSVEPRSVGLESDCFQVVHVEVCRPDTI
jgi:hypothetical protein